MTDPISTLGANPERIRFHNRNLVLSAIRSAGTLGRAQIARSSGLSTQAVSNIIVTLLEDGLLTEEGRVSAGRGLPVQQYAVNPEGGYALGYELRPDAILMTLDNLLGVSVHSARVAITASDPATVTTQVCAMRDDALRRTGLGPDRIIGAGIVMPGPFGDTALAGSPSDLSGWSMTDPVTHFETALGLSVSVENDANAAAMAERITGVARGLRSYAFLYFGQGLGLGIVNDGALVRGGWGNAGEIGHIPVSTAQGPRRLETLVSRLSINAALASAGFAAPTLEALEDHCARATPAVAQWLDIAVPALSQAIGMIENLLDPETVILGGALPARLLMDLTARLDLPKASVANRPDRTAPRVQAGASGRTVATRGAAALILNETFTPAITVTR